jgi:hypothetical protein
MQVSRSGVLLLASIAHEASRAIGMQAAARGGQPNRTACLKITLGNFIVFNQRVSL